MNVLFILPNLADGGVTRTVTNLSKEFFNNGHNVDILTLYTDRKDSNKVSGIRYLKLFNFSVNLFFYIVLLPFILYRLNKFINGSRIAYQGIYSHGLISNLSLALFRKIYSCKTPIIGTEHSTPSQVYMGTTNIAKVFLIKFFYNTLDFVVGVSEGVVRDLVKIDFNLQNKLRCIYNGFEPENIRRLAHELPQRNNKLDDFISQFDYLIVMIGRLTPQKDYISAIRAISKLESESIGLVVVGDGPLRTELESFAKTSCPERIHFTYHLGNPFPILRKANLFLLTSTWESFGNVLVEALTLGIPIVSTDCPYGPAEILSDGQFGVLVPVGDVDAIAQAIICLKSGDVTFASDALKFRSSDFSVDIQYQQFRSLITHGGFKSHVQQR